MIFKLELSPQNFHYDVLYPLYSGIMKSGLDATPLFLQVDMLSLRFNEFEFIKEH
jgi:hypothetical protein